MNGLFSEADLDPEMIKLERNQMERERLSRIESKEAEKSKDSVDLASFDKKLYILDGYSIIYRCYFAHISSPLLDMDGKNCNAYFGFFQTLFFLMSSYPDMDYLAVAMDEKAPTFRHLMYPEYKANRQKAPEDLHAQVPDIVSTLEKMHVCVLSRAGYEADDLIASLTKKATENKIESIMVTGDKDLCQLVSDHVYALRPPKKGETKYKLFGRDDVKNEYGVYPNQIVDYLSILGDASDNVPGIKGLGEKGAVKLLSQYLSFDGIYRHLDSLSAGVRKKLEDGKESGELSRKLVKLSFDALSDDFDFSSLDTSLIKKSAAVEDFEFRKMKSLAKRALAGVGSEDKDIPSNRSVDDVKPQPIVDQDLLGKGRYSAMDIADAMSKMDLVASNKDNVVALDFLALDFEKGSDMVGFAFSYEAQSSYYVALDSENRDGAKALFDKYFLTGKIKAISHNAKFVLKCVWTLGSDIKDFLCDTMIASWMIDSNVGKYSLSNIVSSYFNHTLLDIDDLIEKGEDITSLSSQMATMYSAERADYIYRLYKVLEKKLAEKSLLEPFSSLELPLIRILAKMEKEGIYLSDEKMEDMKSKTDKRLSELVSRIYEEAGHEFNVNSTMQLGKVLFEEKGLKAGRKTQKGFSTDTETLEALKGDNPIVDDVLEYRLLNKLKTTYIDVLPSLRDQDGRIHTSFLQTGTATGRLSSRNPNLQNIPIRTDEGRIIRDAFVPAGDNIFLSADYSQIELCVLAYMADDSNLKNAFISAEDVHKYTASLIFSKPISDIDAKERRIAKTINFGIMYGMSAFRLSNELGISRSDASTFIEKYFERYSGVKLFVDKTIHEAEKNGYVRTKFGHVREILGINSSNKLERSAAERVAVNTIIQGTAAEIMKKAMIDIDKALQEENLKTKMLLQVHDELIFEVPLDEKDVIEALVRDKMENAVKLSIPLRASLEFGHSWGDMH